MSTSKITYLKLSARYLCFFVFCFVFLISFTYLPQKKSSEWENRNLALMPHLFINQKLNENFGKDIEEWLKDQFPFRQEIIKTQFQTMFKINGRVENDQAFMLDNGWIFEKWGTVTYHTQETMQKRLKDLDESLRVLNKLMDQKNLSITFLLLPDKGWLYKDLWEPYYKPYNLEPFYQAEINIVKKYPNIDIIYPYEEMKNTRFSTPLFVEDDVHLSFSGAKFILQSVFDKFQKQYFPNEKIKYKLSSLSQDVVSKLGFDKREINSSYKLVATISDKTINSEETILLKERTAIRKTEVTDPVVNKSLYIYNNCYAQRTLYPLFKHLFKKTIAFSSYNDLSDETKKDFVFKFNKALTDIENDSVVLIIMPLNYNNAYIDMLRDSLKGL